MKASIIGLILIILISKNNFGQNPDAEIFLHKVDSICRMVKNAQYEVSYSRTDVLQKNELFNRAAYVVMSKKIKDKQDFFNINFKFKINIKNYIRKDMWMSYDGNFMYFKSDDRDTILVAPAIEKNRSSITGGSVYNLLMTPISIDSFFYKKIKKIKKITLDSIIDIKNIKQYQISIKFMDGNLKNIKSIWIFNEKFLPQKNFHSYEYEGNLYQDNLFIEYKSFDLLDEQEKFNFAELDNFVYTPYVKSVSKYSKKTIGEESPYWKLRAISGDSVGIDKNNKITILDFGYTSCAPCLKTMPIIQKIHEKYRNKNIEIIGINCCETNIKNAIDYVRRKKYTYKIALNGDSVTNLYNITTFPTIYIINQNRKIIYHHEGFHEDILNKISKIIDDELTKSQ